MRKIKKKKEKKGRKSVPKRYHVAGVQFLICGRASSRSWRSAYPHLENAFRSSPRSVSDTRDWCPKRWRLREIFKKRWNPERQERRSVEEMTRGWKVKKKKEKANERRVQRNREGGSRRGGGRRNGDDDGWVHRNPMSVCFLGRRHERPETQPWTIPPPEYRAPPPWYKLNHEIWGNWGEKGLNRRSCYVRRFWDCGRKLWKFTTENSVGIG